MPLPPTPRRAHEHPALTASGVGSENAPLTRRPVAFELARRGYPGLALLNVLASGMRSVTLVQAFHFWFKLAALAIPVSR